MTEIINVYLQIGRSFSMNIGLDDIKSWSVVCQWRVSCPKIRKKANSTFIADNIKLCRNRQPSISSRFIQCQTIAIIRWWTALCFCVCNFPRYFVIIRVVGVCHNVSTFSNNTMQIWDCSNWRWITSKRYL